MKLIVLIVVSLLLFVLIPGEPLFADPKTLVCTNPDGFWWGLYHGFALFWSTVFSIFWDHNVYEACNQGGWYNAGFLIGVMLWFSPFSVQTTVTTNHD